MGEPDKERALAGFVLLPHYWGLGGPYRNTFMNTYKTRLTLLGIAFGILLALLIAPQTRWLVRLSFVALSVLPGRDGTQRQRIVEAHPNDFQIQLAGRRADTEQTPLDYDRSLVARFPQSPSLRAAILRESTTKEVRLHRDEDNLLEGKTPSPFRPGPNDPAPAPAQLAAFDADAAAGERLDPDNAYFPFMRAVGLFASHRDTEGMAAVERASTKHAWREYFEDPVEGGWRINDAIYGGRESLSATAIAAALLFPHYEQLRHAARVVVYKAVLDEQTGHPEEGLAKREALARCGELMQDQATAIIGNLVGNAICATSRSRPDGEVPPKFDPRLSNLQAAQIRLDIYCAYVTKIGHPEAAAQARADGAAWQQIHRVTDHMDTVFGSQLSDLVHTAIAFFACLFLLPNIFCVFLLGLAAAGLSRLPQLRERRPLPAGASAGFWGAVVIEALLGAAFVDSGPASLAPDAALLLIPLALAGALALALRRGRRPIGVAALTAAAVLGVTGLLGLLASWLTQGGRAAASTVQQNVSISGSDSNAGATAWNNPNLQALLGLAFALAVPLLLAIVLSIVSRAKRVPVSVGLVNGFRSVMPPLVCALMLVYAGLALWTVRQEARANYGLERSLHGEGQYLAEVTGQTWPKE